MVPDVYLISSKLLRRCASGGEESGKLASEAASRERTRGSLSSESEPSLHNSLLAAILLSLLALLKRSIDA